MADTIQVKFVNTRWAAPPDEEDGLQWGIYMCDTPEGRMACKGKLEPNMCQLDMCFQVTGKWEVDRKYGKQFKFFSYARVQPNGEWGTVAFLCQAPGLGEQTASRIWGTFREDSIPAVTERPDEVIEKLGLKGHMAGVIRTASSELGTLVDDMKAKLPLLSLFKGTKIAQKTAQRILDADWNDPVARLQKNPFLLMQFRGIAFKQCDSLRMKLKLSKDMPERIHAACQQVFLDESDQTWLKMEDIRGAMQNLLETKVTDVAASITYLRDEGVIVPNDVGDDDLYALSEDYWDERTVAEQLYMRLNTPGDAWPIDEILADEQLSDHQKEVIVHNMRTGGRVITLTGSPGTGKTFCLGKILHYFSLKNPWAQEYACAPTGKAAQRLTQSLNDNGAGLKATTIHKMLEPLPVDGGWAFQRNAGNKIPENMIAVDETSMVNNWLAARMFAATPNDAYIILVGDKNQLPPVGPGTMLRDLEELPFRELTEVRRNSGQIVATCAAIRDKEPVRLTQTKRPGQDVTPETNCQLVLTQKDERKVEKVEAMVDDILAGLWGEVDKLEDIQFLTATHRNPFVGREAMNKLLQKKLNPNGKGAHKHYKVGDKIICTENTTIKTPSGESTSEFVANGELGYVVESHEKWIVVRMNGANVDLKVTCGAELGNGWDLGYCITCHKSQGSEWLYVVTLMGSDFGSNMVMCREWVYTALSRAKFCSILVSTPGLINDNVKKIRIWDRRSLILARMEMLEDETKAIQQTAGVAPEVEVCNQESKA